MNFASSLKNIGYDQIDGPVRNHKPLQLWVYKRYKEAELYYIDINHAFVSPVELTVKEDPALNIVATKENMYSFNIGISLLDDILKSLGLGAFELSQKLKSGKSVKISYDNSIAKIVPVGEITNYLVKADFHHANPILLKNANKNNILIITGVVYSKNLNVTIDTNFNLNAEFIASLNQAADSKLTFSKESQSSLKMISSGNSDFPIAVKASRIIYDKGVFKDLKLITDKQSVF